MKNSQNDQNRYLIYVYARCNCPQRLKETFKYSLFSYHITSYHIYCRPCWIRLIFYPRFWKLVSNFQIQRCVILFSTMFQKSVILKKTKLPSFVEKCWSRLLFYKRSSFKDSRTSIFDVLWIDTFKFWDGSCRITQKFVFWSFRDGVLEEILTCKK